MSITIDETHDPQLRSWLPTHGTDFPIQNLPLGVFRRTGEPRVGMAIGEWILDLRAVSEAGLLGEVPDEIHAACLSRSLNRMMSSGREVARHLRRFASEALSEANEARDPITACLLPMLEADLLVPSRIGDYTDFYASLDHATNVGSMFRPDHPLLPNYKYIPVGYHGRSSSIVASGSSVRRPWGQRKPPDSDAPIAGPSTRLDYELEIGAWIGSGNDLGARVPIDDADSLLFGLCLVNDWSARDIQAWEYQPLGPFLGKNFATSLSPWIVTIDALEPYRVPRFEREAGDPEPLQYLDSAHDRAAGAFDINVEAYICSEQMRLEGVEPWRVSSGNARRLYWTLAQMVTHHTSGGCNLRPGDLIATGTVSGPHPPSRGCLLELTWGGRDPLTLPTGEQRRFLEDGDEVIFRAYCEREGAARIGFGECRGTVLPTLP